MRKRGLKEKEEEDRRSRKLKWGSLPGLLCTTGSAQIYSTAFRKRRPDSRKLLYYEYREYRNDVTLLCIYDIDSRQSKPVYRLK